MRIFPLILTIAALCGTPLVAQDQAEDSYPGEWVSLFDGKSTEGWRNPYTWGKIEVTNGEIHLTADKKFFLVTEKDYGDFVFEAEINLPEGKANSGFMFRCHVEKNKVYGYQAEVDGSERRWSGGLYDEGRRKWLMPGKDATTNVEGKAKTREEGMAHFAKEEVKGALKRTDWNKYRIVCKGDHIQIFVNGVLTTDVYDSTDRKGPIGIQHHGEKGQTYKFRNLRIKELKE
ncbi:MAG: DUF1080 domain-containing protein [Verrucomicrobiales bacterium]|nr:DUF1080 domain-containing protein [Verrucomicrobiae bacterium]